MDIDGIDHLVLTVKDIDATCTFALLRQSRWPKSSRMWQRAVSPYWRGQSREAAQAARLSRSTFETRI